MKTVNINHRAEKLHHKIHRRAKHHVHRLRGKSDNYRKIFAFTFAFTITLLVFMLWYFLSLPKILDTYKIKKSENERLNDNPVDKFKNILQGDNLKSEQNLDNIEIVE